MEKRTINLDKNICIVNPKQAAFYWSRGVKPRDIYPSVDIHTDTPIIVFVFERTNTYALYKEWIEKR